MEDFSSLLLTGFSWKEILKCHVSGCFKINCEQRIKMFKKGVYVIFRNNERKIKSPFMNYADFQITLMLQEWGTKFRVYLHE